MKASRCVAWNSPGKALILSRSSNDNKLGRRYPSPPQRPPAARPQPLAHVGDAKGEALCHEFLIRGGKYRAVERLGPLEEGACLLRSFEQRCMAIDIEPKRRVPTV